MQTRVFPVVGFKEIRQLVLQRMVAVLFLPSSPEQSNIRRQTQHLKEKNVFWEALIIKS